MLTPQEQERFDRQIMLREIGEAGQEKLKNATVFIAGAGGLGSPIAIYLNAAGIGNIHIVDNDQVELSNLNRQVLHKDADIGRYKADSASEKLNRQYSMTTIRASKETIDAKNVADLTAGSRVIVDAMDNLKTRLLLNKAAISHNIPFVHGAVRGFEGRAMSIIPGKTACLKCMYRGPIPQEKFPVIGVAPAVIGSIQATEAIKHILGIGKLLAGRLLIYDGLHMTFNEFTIKRNPDCDHCGHL